MNAESAYTMQGWPLALSIAEMMLLLAASAAFSASEAVLFSLSLAQVEADSRNAGPFRRMLLGLLRRPKRTLMKILVGNMTINTLFFATSFVLLSSLSQPLGAWVPPTLGLVSVGLLIVLGEVVPKVVAVSLPQRLAPWAAAFIHTVGYVVEPVAQLLDWLLVRPAERILLGRRAQADRSHTLSTAELKALLELSRRRRVINRLEDRFVRAVIDFGKLRVRDVMIPRVQVQAFDVEGDPADLRELIRGTKLKKIPVYNGTMDRIVGLVYAKMLFLAPAGRSLRELALPVRFVPEQVTLEQLLQHFRQSRTQIAMVVDEYGGLAGLVTLEDVLEEIVGDIADEHDALHQPEVVAISESEYEIDGRLSIHYWAELFELPPNAAHVATVAGLVTAELGRAAQVGDRVRLNNVELEVTRMQRFRIERVSVRLVQPAHVTSEAAP